MIGGTLYPLPLLVPMGACIGKGAALGASRNGEELVRFCMNFVIPIVDDDFLVGGVDSGPRDHGH